MTPQNSPLENLSSDITRKMVRRPCLTIFPSHPSQNHNSRNSDMPSQSDEGRSRRGASETAILSNPRMRDKRFVAEHRGGPLRKKQHYQLIQWACDCAENVLYLSGETIDERLRNALNVAKAWQRGNASVGDVRNASMDAIAVARESSDTTAIAVARSVGHAVATAHMADHSLEAALYALKAAKNAGKSIDEERKWQDGQLPSGIRRLILTARMSRNI